MPTTTSTILALDVGTVRIGVAAANVTAQLASPLTTLANDENFTEQLSQLINNEAVGQLIVGLPRGLDSQDTAQTEYVREFARTTLQQFQLPIAFQDEALSSVRAKAELTARGKLYQKADVDALAAAYILEDYLEQNRN